MTQRRPPINLAAAALRLVAWATIVGLIGCSDRSTQSRQVSAPLSDASVSTRVDESQRIGRDTEASGAGPGDASEPVWFTDVTRATGISFRHYSGTNEEKPFPAANGSGLATFDYDRDGLCDLLFATGAPFPLDASKTQPVNEVYRNQGGLRFAEVGRESGLDFPGYSVGLAVGDYDADGFSDVYLVCYGRNQFYRNNGDGTFAEVGQIALVDDGRWGTSAAFLDYDNDGLLDIYVCNYGKWTWESRRWCGNYEKKVRLYCSPKSVEADTDRLFHNRGDGTFANATTAVGMSQPPTRSQGVIVADLNDDGLSDLYVGNDLHANSLFLNTGEGSFIDASEASGSAYDFMGSMQAGMGVDAGDVDGDGLPELVVTNFSSEHNTLYKNIGDAQFQDITQQTGLYADGYPWVGWGAVFADFDLDNWLDLVVVNGHVDDNRHLLGEDAPYRQAPLLWRNVQGRFQRVQAQAGGYFQERRVGRGLAVADLDNDGDLDIVVGHQDDAPAVLRNKCLPQPPDAGVNSVSLQLIGLDSNRDAIGAQVSLHTAQRVVARQVKSGGSYLSANQRAIVFAASDEDDKIRLEIRWPRGKTSVVPELEAGKSYVILEPEAPGLPSRVRVLEMAP